MELGRGMNNSFDRSKSSGGLIVAVSEHEKFGLLYVQYLYKHEFAREKVNFILPFVTLFILAHLILI